MAYRLEDPYIEDEIVLEFGRTYWGQAPFYHHGFRQLAAAFVERAQIASLVSPQKHEAGCLIVTRDGVDGSSVDYASVLKAAANSDNLKHFSTRLASQRLPSVVSRRTGDDYPCLVSPIEKLVASVNYKANVNLYFSPPGESALSAHYDRHDVFVLQLLGAKQWHLLGEDRIKARAGIASVDLEPPTRELTKLTLEVGALLYLPKGIWHRAIAGPEGSVHAAIGLELL